MPSESRHNSLVHSLSLILALACFHLAPSFVHGGDPLSRGEVPLDAARTWIVVPDQKGELGLELASMIEERMGTRLEVVSDSEIGLSDWEQHHFIALGRFSNNAVILELYKNFLAFVDPIFPGPGGIHVKTVVSPFHEGRHVIVLGGSDPEGTMRSVETFLEIIPEDSNSIPPLHVFESDGLPQSAPDAERRAELFEQNVSLYRDSLGASALARIATYGMNYYFTNDEGWAELFRDQLIHFIEEARERGEWYWSPMMGLYFRAGQMLDSWALIEHSDFFTNEERAYITEAFHDLTVELLLEGTYLNERANPLGEPRQNHTSFAALSLDSSIRYFGRRGMDVSGWLDVALPIFEGQLTTYRADDEGSYYTFYGQAHAFSFFAHRDMERVSRPGFLDKVGDLAIMVTDNLRNEITWGDVRTFVPFDEIAYQRYQGVALGLAAWVHRDPAHQWAYQWMNEGKERPIGLQGWMSTLSYALDHDPGLQPPERFLGLTHLLLDEGALRWVAPRVRMPEWMPNTSRSYLDKLTLRSSFDPQDEYLILSGLAAFAHGHEDANAILRVTWKDRIWIADLDYIRMHPRYNNSIDVIVDGATDVLPPLAELRGHVQTPDAALFTSSIESYTGTHWDRSVAWKVGEYFLVMDRVEATRSGHHDLRKYWRLLGEEELSGSRLTLRQPGAQFNIVSGDSSHKQLVRQAEGQSDWSRYPHAEGGFKVYQQSVNGDLVAGESTWFADLMYATDGDDGDDYTLLPVDDSMWMVFRNGRPHALAGSASGGRSIGNLDLDAEVFHLTGEGLDAVGLTSIRTPSHWVTTGKPADITLSTDGAISLHEVSAEQFRLSPTLSSRPISGSDGHGGRAGHLVTGFVLPEPKGLLELHAEAARPVVPREPNRPYAFGLDQIGHLDLGSPVSFLGLIGTEDGASAFQLGLVDGGVLTVRDLEALSPRLDLGREVRAVTSRDGVIFVGDAGAAISAHENGEQLWHVQLGRNRGRLEKIVRLAILETPRRPRLIAVTEGWRVHSYTLEGEEEWMQSFKYHAATDLELADVTGDGRTEIIVGNEYITPIHVFNDEGESLWHAWEQVGSESHSTTEFLGVHAHSLKYVQLSQDDEPGLLLGNGTDEVIHLDGHDGKVRWRANVGGEAWNLLTADFSANGRQEVMVGTGSGYLVLLDADGRRQWERRLTGPANAMDGYFSTRVEEHLVAVGTESGEIAVYDGRGNVLARAYDGSPIEFLRIMEDGEAVTLHTTHLDGTMKKWDFRYPRSAYPPQYRTDRHRY